MNGSANASMSSSSPTDLEAIKSGFSAMASEYDALAESHPVVAWMRAQIRKMVEQELPESGSILEINCGSGLDAAFFAAKGYRVHATDVAPGMLDSLAEKARQPEVGGRITFENLSNTEIGALDQGPYDLVFSNLGGLNCVSDPGSVTRHFSQLLKPGGKAVLVVMPPLCPWEMLQAFRGEIRTAFRRFSRGGAEANIGGSKVRTWYHGPGKLEAAIGSDFETVALRSFCVFAPPPYFKGFAKRHPGKIRTLTSLDDRFGSTWPINRLGDFYALVSRRVV